MIPSNNASGDVGATTGHLFAHAFIRNAHRILFGGYRRLDAPAYRSSEEDEITGDLCREMNGILGSTPEPWMRMFQVHDQYPVTVPGGPSTSRRIGKRRPKIDLQFVANTGIGILRFSWEAKRLGKGHGIAAYLGHAGLGCFLSGQYANECGFGGMLGYAQDGDAMKWRAEISAKVACVASPVHASSEDTSVVPLCSVHERPELRNHISIFHSILQFF